MFIFIADGEIFGPEPRGVQSLVISGNRIVRMGSADQGAFEATGVPVEYIDASDCFVVPGLIDPHEHLLGGSGERGFATQTPEICLSELITGGITTVVGCLGTNTTTKTLPGLLAKAKAFREEGVTAYIYSGGYNVPPKTLTGCVRDDMLLIQEVIGAGEIAIADRRSTAPTIGELARIVQDAYVGGTLSGKCGVTHFHVGEAPERLSTLRALLDDYPIDPAQLYPTHVERSETLMQESIELTHRGVTVDVDTVEQDLARWLHFYLENGGDPARLTVSSDAALNSPATVLQQIRSCVLKHGFALEAVLPLVTTNTARVLRLTGKGSLAEGWHADVLLLRKGSLELDTVISGGRVLMRGGTWRAVESFLTESNREVHLHGQKNNE